MKNVIILALAIAALAAAQPALVTVGGTVYKFDGTGFTGKLTISNASLVCNDVSVPASSRDYSVLSGVVSPAIQLFPLADCTPGWSYTVVYQGNERSTVYWDVRASPNTTTIGVVQRQGPIAPSMTVRWSQLTNVPSLQTSLTWLGSALAGALDQILGSAAQYSASYFQTALGFTPENVADRGDANGYASLDSLAHLPASQSGALTGDVTKAAGGTSVIVTSINGVTISVLSTGLLTNTTGTGTPTITSLPLSPANGGLGGAINVPMHLRFLGDGSDGPINCSGNISQIKFASTFTVSAGDTCTANSAGYPLTIYATGACTIAGTFNARGVDGGNATYGDAGGTGGGGGGGIVAGAAGNQDVLGGFSATAGGLPGVLSGGVGGNGQLINTHYQRVAWSSPISNYHGGGKGGVGGSAGGAGGNGGQSVVLICASISFTGSVNVAGAPGGDSTGNGMGAGGGGGGGFVWLIARDSLVNTGSIITSGGAGGNCGTFTTCGLGGTGGAGWLKVALMQ